MLSLAGSLRKVRLSKQKPATTVSSTVPDRRMTQGALSLDGEMEKLENPLVGLGNLMTYQLYKISSYIHTHMYNCMDLLFYKNGVKVFVVFCILASLTNIHCTNLVTASLHS